MRSEGIGQPGALVYGTGVQNSPWLSDLSPMWELGYNPVTFTNQQDATVVSTTIRDGNFDYVTNQVHWDRAEQPFPDSLYLAASRRFFGSDHLAVGGRARGDEDHAAPGAAAVRRAPSLRTPDGPFRNL